jgi:hypothetical protein
MTKPDERSIYHEGKSGTRRTSPTSSGLLIETATQLIAMAIPEQGIPLATDKYMREETADAVMFHIWLTLETAFTG